MTDFDKRVSFLFSRPGFLDPAACSRARLAMTRGTLEPAEVLDGIVRPDEARRAQLVEVDPLELAAVEQRLDAIRDAISDFHGVTLEGREGSGFVRYTEGDYYRPHVDRAEDSSWPDAARRRIAVVVFLNDDFDGGLLRLFSEEGPMSIRPRAGMLVAFPADLLHEVTPVVRGTRDAIVDWFYGD